MKVTDIKLDWAYAEPIAISSIRDEETRRFIGSLRDDQRRARYTFYICSDARMHPLREAAYDIPHVNVCCNAGNMIYNHNDETLAFVFAHGGPRNENFEEDCEECCGAVHHSHEAHGVSDTFPNIAKEIDGNAIKNARRQLEKVEPRNRGGIFYYDHKNGKLYLVSEQGEYEGHSEAEQIYRQLKEGLEQRLSLDMIKKDAEYQDPHIAYLSGISNINTHLRIFRINMQMGKWHPILWESLGYSLLNATTEGNPNFNNTNNIVMAFRGENGVPVPLSELLNKDPLLKKYVLEKEGDVYIATLSWWNPTKKVYRLTPKSK